MSVSAQFHSRCWPALFIVQACLFAALPAVADIEWVTGFDAIVVDQVSGFDQTYDESDGAFSTASLVSSEEGTGDDQNYKVNADQLTQSSFQLVNIDDPGDSISMDLFYTDGVVEELSDGQTSTTQFPGKAAGTTPRISVAFSAPAGGWDWLCGFASRFCGSGSWGKTYVGFIDVCAFAGGSCGQSQSDRSQLAVVFNGWENSPPDYVRVSGLAAGLTLINPTPSTPGSNWLAADDFCVGVTNSGNVRISAESLNGNGAFEMLSAGDSVPYRVFIESIEMSEGVYNSFAGQPLNDCSSLSNQGFQLEVRATDSDVNTVPAGTYTDTLKLLFIPE